MSSFTINSGFFSTDGGAMFGIMSRKVWSHKYPTDEDNRSPLAMRCFFADFGQRKVLFDTGAGMKPLHGMDYYRFHDLQAIEELLAAKAYRAEDITDVVLSHLHFDHCGGCTRIDKNGKIVMTFPNAQHWTTEEQWQNALHPHAWEADAYLMENMQAVSDSGKLSLLKEDCTLFPGLTLKIFQGHTYGQLVSFIQTDEQRFIFSGDVIPMALHTLHGCIAAVDNHALLSMDEKIRLLHEARDFGGKLIFYHDAVRETAEINQASRLRHLL